METHLKLRRLQIELEQYSRRLESAQERLKCDLELARQVQQSFLPRRVPEVAGYQFSAHYAPAYEVGGDYYDFILLPGKKVAVLVGDVSGKGVAAALLMAKLSADARVCILSESDPATAFTRLNALMNNTGIPCWFVTLVAAILDPVGHTVTFVNAGHASPLLYRRTSRTVCEASTPEMGGVPLCVMEDFAYPSCQIRLEPGDSVLLFTDGVTDAMNIDDLRLETERVYAVLAGGDYSTHALVDRVVDLVRQFTLGRQPNDDIALVGFGRPV